ncbi:MAG: phosphoenolpyruvate--protein phosphotransferase [Propionibacteriales bacterium]|nr:phosphoenolpyruvate--protein phosphotransferase [Propionibacteriales bacterium]
MISIVVVSHSRALAEAVVALAEEMVKEQPRPTIALAAGLDETTFGTDAVAVAEAIAKVDSPDGVLVMLDLGSAVLSAELALELLDADVAERVTVTSAPLVEGLVAAVVTASTGAKMPSVVDEARRGLVAKAEHLGDAASDVPGPAPDAANSAAADDDAETVELQITNAHGLHARPAARVVSLVRGFDAEVTLTNIDTGRGPVSAASLSLVATLDARRGHTLRVRAAGPEAAQAVAALRAMGERGFDDVDSAGQDAPTATGPISGAAPGSGLDIAIGPAVVNASDVDVSSYAARAPKDESERSQSAVDAAIAALGDVRRAAAGEAGDAQAVIFDAQLGLLEDPEVTQTVAAQIASGAAATTAWAQTLGALAADFETLSDLYQRERAQDVRSVLRRVLRVLVGEPEPAHAGGGILVVDELDAATAAGLDLASIRGIVTRRGGSTGHGVIVAKSRGVPLITDVGDEVAGVQDGTVVAFDARSRSVWVNPDVARRRQVETELERRAASRSALVAAADLPARTSDGVRIHVVANVASVAEARAAVAQGAEGSGLVRTEVLFGGFRSAPSVEEQVELLLAVSAALDGRPMTVRTWDVGGDKSLAFLPLPTQANPFLGTRGIRAFRTQPELLLQQLQAVCLVAQHVATKVMFPMVTTRDEVRWARARLKEAAAATTGDVPGGLEVGVMVEVPAAALKAATLAAGLDFVSIGTNDLTQYTTAAERGNAAVAGLADPFDPAVVRLIEQVCATVGDQTTVAVCGDLASSAAGARLLVGLGVRELSCPAPQVPEVKAALRAAALSDLAHRGAQALDVATADDVRALAGP